MSCTHSIETEVDKGYEDYDGVWQADWQTTSKSTTVDIDLHRYKCTQCGQIFYYSSKARAHFEGTKQDSWIDETNKRYMKIINK